jgi:hypothetical protein
MSIAFIRARLPGKRISSRRRAITGALRDQQLALATWINREMAERVGFYPLYSVGRVQVDCSRLAAASKGVVSISVFLLCLSGVRKTSNQRKQ